MPVTGMVDHAGNPMCGDDFMAGTICTLPPGHDGAHDCTCQCCGGDWMNETCTCVPTCPNCGKTDMDDEYLMYCGDCGCTQQQEGTRNWCQLLEDHEGAHDFSLPSEPLKQLPCQQVVEPPSEEEVADTIASILSAGRRMQ